MTPVDGHGAHGKAMGAAPGLDRCPIMPSYGPPPVLFTRGEGSWLWDRDGKEYLDFLSGLGVTGLGHAHPEVAEAISDQARTLLHGCWIGTAHPTKHAPRPGHGTLGFRLRLKHARRGSATLAA